MKDKKIAAIIPARGSSTSAPPKNIKSLGGFPLLSYSIANGLCSQFIDRVIVSTEDEEIAETAVHWGAEVPFLRPARLTEEHVDDLPVFEHAIQWLETHDNYRPDIIVQLRPTTPFRPKNLTDKAISLLLNNPCDSVRGVTHSGQNPYKMWRIVDEQLVPLVRTDFPEPYNMPQQKLPPTFWQTGHVEVIRYETIINKKSMTGNRILPMVIDSKFCIHLNTDNQWEFAEYILEEFDPDIWWPADVLQNWFQFNSCFSKKDSKLPDDILKNLNKKLNSFAVP